MMYVSVVFSSCVLDVSVISFSLSCLVFLDMGGFDTIGQVLAVAFVLDLVLILAGLCGLAVWCGSRLYGGLCDLGELGFCPVW